MGDAIRDDDHVSLPDVTALAALDVHPANLIRGDDLRRHSYSTGDERRGASQHMYNVRVAQPMRGMSVSFCLDLVIGG